MSLHFVQERYLCIHCKIMVPVSINDLYEFDVERAMGIEPTALGG